MLCIKIHSPIMDKYRASLRQLYAAIAVNLVTFSYGVYSAWPAVVQNTLLANSKSTQSSPLGAPLDEDTFTWIASLGMGGAMLGTLFWGVVADKYGRKITGYLTMVPFLLNWMILLAVKTEWALILARVLGGMGASGAAVNCPTYVSELSDDRMNDVLGSLFMLTYNLGVLYVFVVGTFVSYDLLNIAGLAVSGLFVITWYFARESPVFLLRQNEVSRAKDQLKWFRCKDSDKDVEDEVNERMAEINQTSRDTACSAYFELATIKALIIGFVFQTGTQLSGINVILTYAVDIFQKSGSQISPSMCIILVGSVQVCASVIASCMVKRYSRKSLIIFTYVFTTLALFILGLCLYSGQMPSPTDTGILPVLSLSLLVISFSMGLGMVPYIIYTEIFPANVRNVCISALMFWNHALSFGVVKACGKHMGYESFWVLSAMCLLIVPYTYLCVPETKGKSIMAIQRELLLCCPGLKNDRGEDVVEDENKISPLRIENGQAASRYRESGKSINC